MVAFCSVLLLALAEMVLFTRNIDVYKALDGNGDSGLQLHFT
jgi:hypothetical protein